MDNKNLGDIKVSDEVVSITAFLATKNIPGVSSMQNSIGTGIAEFLGKKNVSKGVKVNVNENEAVIDLYIIVDYGVKIPDVAWQVQEKVKIEVEKVTGLNVLSVNVHIEGIDVENTKNEEDWKVEYDFENQKHDYDFEEDTGCQGNCSSCGGCQE